jgi:ABC-type antimicrobial peptide transport system permease subunit
VNDLRYAFRLLRRDLGYTVVAIVAMTVGIGATTTLFSVAYGVARTDVATYITVAFAVAVVSTIASVIPAGRAARIDPLVALRAD